MPGRNFRNDPNYPKKRVVLKQMLDPYTTLTDGMMGTIVGEDDAGHLLVDWDNGSRDSLLPGIDEYEIVESARYIKMFEEFVVFNTELIHSKMSELQDILPINVSFKYDLQTKNGQGVLLVRLEMLESRDTYDWSIDLDDPKIELSVNGDLNYSERVSDLDEILDVLEKEMYEICGITERVKSQRYKGRKIPGKYLTKNPGKMKKEIDTYRDKKEYKRDWDADYESGKGGVGKRVKTKKSAATKAYHKMFGNK
jgi:hypothetical protein